MKVKERREDARNVLQKSLAYCSPRLSHFNHLSSRFWTTPSCAVPAVDSLAGARPRHAVSGAGARMAAGPGALGAALDALRAAAHGRSWRARLERRAPRPLHAARAPVHPLPAFACPACGDVLRQPVTGACGHTCCRACRLASTCPACGATARAGVNVLVQELVARWWSAELMSCRAAQDAERLLAKTDTDAALAKCNKALSFTPNYHQLLAVRAQVFNATARYQDALADTDDVIKLRPTWSKGHFVRAVILSNLGQHDDALVSYFVSAALGHNPQVIQAHVSLCLTRMLPMRPKKSKKLVVRVSRNYRRKRCLMLSRNRSSKTENKSSGSTSGDQMEANAANNNWDVPHMHQVIDRIFAEVKKYSEMTPIFTELQVETILVDQSDFECVLCCRSLWRPVTTPCGHTYCWHCLERSLDYRSSCPLCQTSLDEYLSNNTRSITTFIDEAMKNFIPMEYIARKISHIQEVIGTSGCEPYIPVFVCTTAFPAVSCPLFVFEPRYRLMVRRCLESGSRQFGIAACLDKNATGPDRYAEFGTILEIKDCVLMRDGCSILSTVGVRRFRVLARGERDGYDIAQVENVEDNPIEPNRRNEVMALHNKVKLKAWHWFKDMDEISKNEIVQTFGLMPDEEDEWSTQRDGPSWTWWVVAILPFAPQLKVTILSTLDLEKRLRAIDRTLDYLYFLSKKKAFVEENRQQSYTDYTYKRPLV